MRINYRFVTGWLLWIVAACPLLSVATPPTPDGGDGSAVAPLEIPVVTYYSTNLTDWVGIQTNNHDSGFVKFELLDLRSAVFGQADSEVDFSCVFVDSNRKVATLIGPSTAFSCEHYPHGVGDELVFGAETTTVTAVHLSPDWQDGYMEWDYVWFELDPPVSTEHAILAPTNWFEVVGDPSYNPSRPADGLPVTVVYTSVKRADLGSKWALDVKGIFGYEGSGAPVGFRLNGRFVVIGDMISYGGQFSRPDDIDIERGWGW